MAKAPKVTTLSKEDEAKYREWMRRIGQTKEAGQNVDGNLTGLDYDYRGFFKKYGPVDVAKGQHFTDEFKLPNHPTFSVESVYAVGDNKAKAGHWDGDTFVPPAKGAAMSGRPELTDSQRERLKKAGVDPDQWLAQELKNAPELKKQGSKWIENHLGQQEAAGTLANTRNDPDTPYVGEALEQHDKNGKVVGYKYGPPPKDGGEWTIVDTQFSKDGSKHKVVLGTGKKTPTGFVPTQTSQDGGKTFTKVNQVTAPDGSKTFEPDAAPAPSAGVQYGVPPVKAGQGMSAAEEQLARGQLAALGTMTQQQIDQQIAQAKAQVAGDQGYAEFHADSPGNTPILKRGQSFGMPNMGPNGPLPGASTGSLSVPQGTTIDDELRAMYRLPPDQLKKLQTDLFNGGYYGSGDISQVPFGQPDQSTLTAYHALLSDVAQRNRAGQQVTVEDVLESSAAAGQQKVEKAKPKFQPIDPRDAAAAIDAVAQQVVGRKATVEEQRLMLAAWNHSGELAFNAQQNPGQVATRVADPSAIAEDLLLQKNPQEAFGYGLTGAMDTLLKLAAPAVQVGGLG